MRLRNQPAAKVRLTLSRRRLVVGAALGAMLLSVSVFLYLNIGNSHESKAAGTYNAVVNNGSWNTASTWSIGRVPADGDIITIPAGYNVNFGGNKNYNNLTLNVYGTLTFSNGDKLDLNAASVVNVYSGGSIIGGNNGTFITIGSTSYRGTFNITGPTKMTDVGFTMLPIRLLSFTAVPSAEGVALEWVTAAEQNNDFYTIERSTDARTFQAVAQVQGAGNSSSKLTYQATDKAPLNGTSYYRLRQTDFNGESTVSKTVSVTLTSAANTASAEKFRMYPNPALVGDNLTLDLPAESSTIAVLDKNGKVISTQTVDAGSTSEQLALTSVTPGLYMVKVQVGNQVQTQRLVVR